MVRFLVRYYILSCSHYIYCIIKVYDFLLYYTPAPPEGVFLYPRSTGRGYTVLPLSVRPSFHLSVRPSACLSVCLKIFFVAFFSAQQLLMIGILYLVTIFILVCHIVGSVFGPIRFLLPVCRLGWFLYTLNIYAGVHIEQTIRNGNGIA